MTTNMNVTRRGFLAGTAALSFVIAADGLALAKPLAGKSEMDANAWIRIHETGTVTVVFPITEMGQGSSTALPMILAEELDADWDKVEVEQLNRDDKTYGNPIFGGFLYTAGSTGVYGYYPILRKAGAQARAYLMAIAAKHWDVPVKRLRTEPGSVIDDKTRRILSYGEIVGLDATGVAIPDAELIRLKSPDEFRLVGQNAAVRRDTPSKTDGTAQFAYDVRVPGMLYGAVLRTPVEGETPLEVNDADTLATDGVVRTVTISDAVIVVATTQFAAQQGRDMLDVTWSETSPARTHDSEQALADYQAAAEDKARAGAVWREDGNARTAVDQSAKVVEATYLSDHAYHGQIEPMAAVAHVQADGKTAEVWAGTQTQSWTMRTVTQTLDTTPDKVTLNMMQMGGSFGRRTELSQDYVREALLASKAAGAPVKILWTREEDVKFGRFRPAAAQHLRAGLGTDGALEAMHHRVAAPSVIEFFNPIRWSQVDPKDIITMKGSESKHYKPAHFLAEHVKTDRVARLAPWRGIGASYTSYAAEAFMDEVAEQAGMDAIEFRLGLMKDNPRGQALLTKVAEMADWKTKRDDTALGVAFAGYSATMAAGIAEISLDRETGEIKLRNFWAAVDAGLVVAPDNAINQIEGGIVFGMSSSLRERVTITEGQVDQENFYDYEMIRANEVPPIEIHLANVDAKPEAVGEAGTPMVAPAIANAFYALTGKRIRHLPFTPDRVLEVLEA